MFASLLVCLLASRLPARLLAFLLVRLLAYLPACLSPAWLLACLPACLLALFACLYVCLLACLPACLLAWLLACLPARTSFSSDSKLERFWLKAPVDEAHELQAPAPADAALSVEALPQQGPQAPAPVVTALLTAIMSEGACIDTPALDDTALSAAPVAEALRAEQIKPLPQRIIPVWRGAGPFPGVSAMLARPRPPPRVAWPKVAWPRPPPVASPRPPPLRGDGTPPPKKPRNDAPFQPRDGGAVAQEAEEPTEPAVDEAREASVTPTISPCQPSPNIGFAEIHAQCAESHLEAGADTAAAGVAAAGELENLPQPQTPTSPAYDESNDEWTSDFIRSGALVVPGGGC